MTKVSFNTQMKFYETFIDPDNLIGSQETIRPFKTSHGYGSTDVGDVSWNVPTAGLRTATWGSWNSISFMASSCNWRNFNWS